MTARIWPFNPAHPNETRDTEMGIQMGVETGPDSKASRVLVGGCFDVLHFGHIQFLQAAKALGSILTIALEPDEKILLSKHRRPIHSQIQRAEILSHLRFVDEIILLPVLNDYEEYLTLVLQLKPCYLAVTLGDTQLDNKRKQAEMIGAELKIVTDNISNFSSSHLIKEKDWI